MKLAGPTVCSAADTGSFVVGRGGGCAPAPRRCWCPFGEQQAALGDAKVIPQET